MVRSVTPLQRQTIIESNIGFMKVKVNSNIMMATATNREQSTKLAPCTDDRSTSDGSSLATYGALAHGNPHDPHPRSYGTFARVLGKYVREMQIMPLEEAIRKMTSLPAARFGISDRGRLVEGFFADITVFDPATIADQANISQTPSICARGRARSRERPSCARGW